MGSHIVGGEFQSDKYPTCPRGKVPLSTKDPTAQDLLWEYAQRRRPIDAEFADDLEQTLLSSGYRPTPRKPVYDLYGASTVWSQVEDRLRLSGWTHDGRGRWKHSIFAPNGLATTALALEILVLHEAK